MWKNRVGQLLSRAKQHFLDVTVKKVIEWIVAGIVLVVAWLCRGTLKDLFWTFMTYLSCEIVTPRWVLWLLTIGTLALIGLGVTRVVRFLIGPPHRRYTCDEFDAVRWRWGYRGREWQVKDLTPYCPKCDTELAWKPCRGTALSLLFCETCNSKIGDWEGHDFEIRAKTQRQIEMKIRTGKWREKK